VTELDLRVKRGGEGEQEGIGKASVSVQREGGEKM